MPNFREELEEYFILVLKDEGLDYKDDIELLKLIVEYTKIPNTYTAKDDKNNQMLMMMMLKNQMEPNQVKKKKKKR